MEISVSDSEMIQSVLSGDIQSFEGIVLKYQERVMRLCASIVGPSAAEDAAQETFLKVYGSLGQFKGASAFSSWLYRIAYNHCLNILSKKKREKTDSLDALVEQHGESIPPLTDRYSHTAVLESKETVGAVLEKMSPEERVILTLREMEGLNYKELAETLDISVDLVKVRLFRARKSFLSSAKKFL